MLRKTILFNINGRRCEYEVLWSTEVILGKPDETRKMAL